MISLKKIAMTLVLSICLLVSTNITINAETINSITTADQLKSCLTSSNENTCVLSDNITLSGNIRIAGNKILDLNGKIIDSNIAKTGVFIVESTKLTINDSTGDGIIKNNKGYGIHASKGGTVIFNSGTISSNEAALSGNNTNGDMNFEVNGGTLTASYGAAIYMPGQGKLKITNGTLNGGLNLRMGQVEISGGTIQNTNPNNADTIKEYYNYSGNVWYGDAIAINSGTYTSNNTTYGNSLNLTISGGTINSTMGNAFALYSLGKVSQNVNITITGGAFSGKDGAILVKDMTKESYVNDSYKTITNKPIIQIKGGTYNTTVKDYMQATYIEEKNNIGYVVKPNIKLSTTDEKGNTIASFKSEIPMPNDYYLSIKEKNIDNNTQTAITASTIKKIEEIHNNSNTTVIDPKLIAIYDISIIQNNQVIKIEGENNYIISLKLDDNVTKNYKYYKVIYLDDNNEVKEVIDANVKDGWITFQTTHLSTYAMIGYNTQQGESNTLGTQENNPKTFDGITKYIILEVIALSGLAYIVRYIKRKMNS